MMGKYSIFSSQFLTYVNHFEVGRYIREHNFNNNCMRVRVDGALLFEYYK